MQLTPFGKLIRRHRLDQSLSLNHMVSRIGVTAAFASAVETGAKKIPADYPGKVAAALDLDEEQTQELQDAANLSFSEVRIPLHRSASRADREMAQMFARRFPGLSEDKKDTIRNLLREEDDVE